MYPHRSRGTLALLALLCSLALMLMIRHGHAQPVTSVQPAAGGGILARNQVAATTNGTTTVATFGAASGFKQMVILINISAGGTATGTLQLFIEDSLDNGTSWDDVVSSNTFVFGAATTTQRFRVSGEIPTTITQGSAQATESLAAGTVRQGPWGNQLRVREVITGISGSPVGPTYSVTVLLK